MDNLSPLLVNVAVFTVSSLSSNRFLSRALFSEQDLSRAWLNKAVFSVTFGLCMVMLCCFLQQVQNTFDLATARQLWRVLFIVMDVMLLCVIPLALLKDLCCQKSRKKKKHFKSTIVSIFACSCFTIIFLVDALIFNTYIGTGNTAAATTSPAETLQEDAAAS